MRADVERGANLITIGNAITTPDNINFTISGLGALTGAEGDFVFTAAATAVQDTFATSGQGSQSSAWKMITTQPRITAVQQVATNPRNIVVQTLNVTFSHAINPATFTYSDLALTRNGGANLINSGVTITALNATNYQLGEISWLQGLAGNYSLTINAAAINDLAGNSGSGSTNVAWQMILDTPPTPANLVIAPDLGISATDGLTSTNPITLSGTIGTTNLTVRIYDESVATDLGIATVTGTNFAASLYIATPGTHRLKVTAIDVAGNVSPASYTTAFLDQIRPTASFTPVASPVYSAINPVNVLCSEGINPATLSLASFSITRDVTNTITPTITLVSTNIIQLGGLSTATYPLGIYTVTANLNGIQDYAGNIATNVLSLTWERVTSNLPPVLTAITNRVITPDGGFAFRAKATDPNGDKLTFALGAGTPADAVIVATNGLVRWNPTRARASTTNQFSIIVADNGYPFMSATNTFIVTVLDYLDVTFGQTNLLGGNTATLPIWISSSEGVSNVQFNLNVPSSVLTNWILIPESAQLASSTLQTQGSAIVVHLQTLPGQIIQGTQQVSHLEFKATTNQQSQFITLAASNIGGIKPGGIIYSNNVNGGGRVVVVQELPLLEGLILTNHSRQLSIYGRPGTNYELQTANAMTQPVTWSPVTSLTQTNVLSPITVSVTNSLIFYRLKQLP